jgi:hypothetical protein
MERAIDEAVGMLYGLLARFTKGSADDAVQAAAGQGAKQTGSEVAEQEARQGGDAVPSDAGGGAARQLDDAGSGLSRNVTSASELDSNMLNSLKNEGVIDSAGRSGEHRPLTGTPNSYLTTPAGHALVYDSSGRLIYDISPQRVKMTVWDQAPDGNLYSRDVKLDGAVPSGLLGN